MQAFVAGGGGLIVLGEEEEDKYGGNLNELLAPFGVRFENAIVFDYDPGDGVPSWIVGEAGGRGRRPRHPAPRPRGRLLPGRGAGGRRPRRRRAAHPRHRRPAAAPALLAAVPYKEGRVVVVADSDLFGDDYLARRDNRQLWLNLVYWVALAAFRSDSTPIVSEAAQDPAWLRLKEATDALRLLQEPKGEVDLEAHDVGEVRALVVTMAEAIADLAPRFPHEEDYLAQVVVDLQDWVEGGCGKPDFRASLDLFRPELHREDGIENLVVFPMYTPNGSPDTRFEALITRTPWPEFVAELERERLRQRQVRAGAAGRQHRGLRQRVRGALPRDGERRRTADQPLRRHLLRPRVLPVPALDAARAPRSSASTCRPTPWRSRRRRTSRSRRTSSGT